MSHINSSEPQNRSASPTGGGPGGRPASRRFAVARPTAYSIAEARRAQQFERRHFEDVTGVRLDAQGHIIRPEELSESKHVR